MKNIFYRFNIYSLIFIFLFLHVLVIPFPMSDKVFDEAYYTQAGNDLLDGIASNAEHPFLGKLWGSIGISIFGDNWLGWRIHSVIFGALTVFVFYHFANLFIDKRKSLYASTLLVFENIFFIHSSLYLLEVPALFFSLAALYCYFKKKYFIMSFMFALALLSKETSIFFLTSLIFYHTCINIKKIFNKKINFKFITFIPVVKKFVICLIILSLFTGIPMWIYDILYKPNNIENPVQHLKYMLDYQSGLSNIDKDFYPYEYAWNWVLPLYPEEMIYYDISISKNVTSYTDDGIVSSKITTIHPIHWSGIGNIPLWLIGFWCTISGAMYFIIKRIDIKFNSMILIMIFGTYLPYIFISYMGRIVYPFYFITSVPFIILGISNIINYKKTEKYYIISFIFLLIVLSWFIVFFPLKFLDFPEYLS